MGQARNAASLLHDKLCLNGISSAVVSATLVVVADSDSKYTSKFAYRFSATITLLPDLSSCEYRIHFKSGEIDSPISLRSIKSSFRDRIKLVFWVLGS